MENTKIVDKDWSMGMESEEYEQDMELLIRDAIHAVSETGKGHFVNLVTPSVHGDPDLYLTPILKNTFGDKITTQFVDQCGCGGYVLKVRKQQ